MIRCGSFNDVGKYLHYGFKNPLSIKHRVTEYV